MSVPLWAWELARAFADDAGRDRSWPRDLRTALGRSSLLVTVDEVPGLTVRRVRAHLRQRGCPWQPDLDDRRLRACLVAKGEVGWIVLDANDPADEKRFSLAHELAHFLRHVWQPRLRAAALGGEDLARRAAAALRGVRLAPLSHLMGREGRSVALDVAAAEEEADRLAVELLAPEDEVVARLSPGAQRADAEVLLRDAFGLPARVAAAYAARLIPGRAATPLTDRLRKTLNACRTSPPGGE